MFAEYNFAEMIDEIDFIFDFVVYRSTLKVVLTIFRILFCKKPF